MHNHDDAKEGERWGFRPKQRRTGTDCGGSETSALDEAFLSTAAVCAQGACRGRVGNGGDRFAHQALQGEVD